MESTDDVFDEAFEATRLKMLAQQFPEIAEGNGTVVFHSEDHEARLSHARWTTEGNLFADAGKSGFKLYLMELINMFIQYRARCGQPRWKKGTVRIKQGVIEIEWAPDDLIETTQRE